MLRRQKLIGMQTWRHCHPSPPVWMKIPPHIEDFGGESRGFLPLARAFADYRGIAATLTELAGVLPKASAKGLKKARFANIFFVHQENRTTYYFDDKALPLEGPLYLCVDIGALNPHNIVINPTLFPSGAIDWSAPEVAKSGGVWLDVVVFSQDFLILASDLQPLWLPQFGPSEQVSIPLRLQHEGLCELRLALYYRDNLLQSFLVQAFVGEAAIAPFSWGNRARIEYSTVATMDAVMDVPGRAATIITNHDRNGRMRVQVKSKDLRDDFSPADASDFVKSIRSALDKICTRRLGTETYMYLFGGADSNLLMDNWNKGNATQVTKALKLLAGLGWELYEALFSRKTREIFSQQLAGEGDPIHIARVVQRYVIPWSVIYDRKFDELAAPPEVCLRALDALEAGADSCHKRPECPLPTDTNFHVVCPWHFWGFRRSIEQPAQYVEEAENSGKPAVARKTPRLIDGGQWLAAVNTTLDMLDDHLNQLATLAQNYGLQVTRLDTRQKILDNLEQQDPGMVYFYCHGHNDPPHLTIGKNQLLRPKDLALNSSWTHAPLVFINGCHTLAFSPESLAGFISRFVVDHGAAGVVGTEISIYEVLAAEVAWRFFKYMLEGKPAGEAMRQVRLDLLRKHNPLGLVYTLFCDADLRLAV
ncbi:MAG: CHAT domain-containing protein [Anaerolineae bacterium]|nr:CHAT domain-containing protein [Anaerolineae bacterium]